MIKNKKGNLYTGITSNISSRARYHNKNQGAEFTKNKPGFKLVFTETYNTLSEARKREIQIKKWRRDKKEVLISKYSKNLPTKQKTTNN